ncbi:glycosyltransferase family 4 protein [Paenibacillus sp. CF384]|uniref:glycosyltransferase family 4 protein n=1 Tax=Paenibacillus sp. CF384 TaxID=1884382 RepID=UPI00089B8598|nr:glycosyltransferase family 4 protein [Paenibacillus sp. CF384]SDX26867.1 galacturonosyltransferase [Paenibacillus sp. CF384]
MKQVLILSNHHAYTYNFRKETIKRLIDEKYNVYIVLPYGEKVELLKEMGCKFIDLPLDRRGMNPLTDLKLLIRYYKTIKQIKPDVVLSFTVKPNIYGGLVCRKLKVPHISNITGLGTAVESVSLVQKMLIQLYKLSFKKISCIFFQNKDNQQFFIDKKIALDRHKIIPGSGVNLEHFKLIEYPSGIKIEFVFISRIMKEKGIDQYLEAAEYISKKHPNTRFHILGFCEENYEEKLKEMQDRGIIQYHGMRSDVREFLQFTHCTIHPSYYPEGISNVLLESAACGRPIITTNRSGCRDVVDDGVNGYIIEQRNSNDLIEKIEKFLDLDIEEKQKMGMASRVKVEKEFDRKIVVEAYVREIEKALVK